MPGGGLGTLPSKQGGQAEDNNLPLILGAVGLGSVLLIGLIVGLVMMSSGGGGGSPPPLPPNPGPPVVAVPGNPGSSNTAVEPAKPIEKPQTVTVSYSAPVPLPSGHIERLMEGELELWVPGTPTLSLNKDEPGNHHIKEGTVDLDDKGLFIFEEEWYPGIPDDRSFSLQQGSMVAMLNNQVRRYGGSADLESSSRIEKDGIPGREINVKLVFRSPSGEKAAKAKLHVYFFGKKAITLYWIQTPRATAGSEQTFFESFRRVNPNGANLTLGGAPAIAATPNAAPSTPPATNVAAATSIALPNEGTIHRFADGEFEIWMPVQPNEQIVPSAPGQQGGKAAVAISPKYGFFVVASEALARIPNDQEYAQIEQNIISGATKTLSAMNGKMEVKTSTKTEILGMPGRDLAVAVTTQQGNATVTVNAKIRLIFTGKLLLMLQAVITSNANANVETTFYNSFRRVDPNGSKPGSNSFASAASPSATAKPATNTALPLTGQVVRSSDGTVAVNLPSVPPGEPEKKQGMGTDCLIRDLKVDANGRFVFAEYSLPAGKTARDLVLSLVDEPIPGVKSPGAVRKRDISLEGRPTYEIEFDQGNDLHKAKIVGYGSKVYVLLYVGPKDKVKEKAVVDFLRSFRVGAA